MKTTFLRHRPLRVAAHALALVSAILFLPGCVGGWRQRPAMTDSAAPAGRSEAVHAAVADWLARWPTEERVFDLAELADAIAIRLEAGGRLFAAGDAGFCDEMDYRAGGLAGMLVWDVTQRLQTNDVLLVGLFDSGDKESRLFKPSWIGENNGRFNKSLTVVIASRRWPLVDRTLAIAKPAWWSGGLHLLDTDAPPTVTQSDRAVGQAATLAAAWALQGELFAAAARRGRTLAVYTSLFEPGSKEFNDRIKGRTFLTEPRIEPIPAGRVARSYLNTCRGQVSTFADSAEPRQVRLAAARIAACQRRGGTTLTVLMGHVLQRGAAVPPELWTVAPYGSAWSWKAPEGLRPGDVLCFLGYLEHPRAEAAAAVAAGAEAVTLSVAGAPDAPGVTNIRCFWRAWDGCVEAPGYPYRILPSSGVAMTAVWYSIMDEALALAR